MWISTNDLSIIKGENIEKIYTELINLKTKDDCWEIDIKAYLRDEDESKIIQINVSNMEFVGHIAIKLQKFLFAVITKGIDVDFTCLPKYDYYNPLQKSDLKSFTEALIKCVADEHRADMFLVVGIL